MAVHLISYLKEQFTPAVIDQLGLELNESSATIQKVIDGALPTLLGGLTRRIQATGGATALIHFLDNNDYRNTPLDLSQVIGNQLATAEATASGRDFLNHIFGDNLTNVTELISLYGGAKPQSAFEVLAQISTILMGILGRQEQEKGLTAENLKTLLLGQATEFRQMLPKGLEEVGRLMGFDELVTPAGPQTEVQGTDNLSNNVINPNIPKSPEGERRHENVRWLRWAMVAIAVLVLALLIQKCSQNQNGTDGVSTDSTRTVESNAVEDTSAATKQSIEEANGQTTDSTASGPLGTRDSSGSNR
ncbi:MULTISPECIES: DUF937 domain-containing protein [unclassified Spirosoma]|mgnify:CR=1 FL=1|uniref:DUF937 domain-containing protein n=1 Tax=unclassified Spirosoma TaxID=2621999 RepID=UPI000961AD45|nr:MULTISPECIES: DUF937 domain-containing protein [unclassified Spirosoma]MBN8821750.1 DUF937 domain-containing protein [Spirosoma sp.]OJW80757.1 MAG: hypothetical protein BGO59_35440 [Spirosoma sp. 48-14]